MSQADEQPLSKDEIKRRARDLWSEELECVRQQSNPDLTSFEIAVEKELQRRGVHPLPPMDMAMWPECVLSRIDVSDPQKFNDRFIELPVEVSSGGFFRTLHGFPISLLLVAFLASFAPDVEIAETAFLAGGVLLVFGPLLFWLHVAGRSDGVGGTRYNRQAQLVHEMDEKGNVAHVPWRHVRPVVNMGVAPSSILMLLVPYPRAALEEDRLRSIGSPYQDSIDKLLGPFKVNATLHYGDHASVASNLQRLDFLRRYMEHGIGAVQPSEEAVRLGMVEEAQAVEKPQDLKNLGWLMRYVIYPLDKVWYWICLGPLLDRQARKAAERTRWPKEVEDLCGPCPDLRGLDTRPIRSSTQYYYKPTAYNWTVVDRNGNPTFAAKGMPPGSAASGRATQG